TCTSISISTVRATATVFASKVLRAKRSNPGQQAPGASLWIASSPLRGFLAMTGAKMHSPILVPLIALVLWSFVMWVWLYATRIPAIVKNKIAFDPHRPKEEFHALLPAQVRWKADNYNHLMEQPTLFYAVALTLALIGEGTGLNAGLAWLYVG